MLSLTPQSSFSKRNRPRSSLKVQTASCLLSAAAVLTVSIMPLGTAASLIGPSTRSLTPTASPASSPVVAYFGQDLQSHSAEGRERTDRSGASVVMGATPVGINESDHTYMDSTAAYPLSAGASSFLLQVDSPNEDRSYSAPPFSDNSPALERRTRRSRQPSDRLLVRADPSATTSGGGALGFTVHYEIASTYSPTSSGATATSSSSNTPSPTTLSQTPTNLPAVPISAIALPSAFPQPFDQSLSYSLTDSCVAFLARYLESEQMTGRTKGARGSKTTVGKCGRPFGLLVSSSSRWAQM